MMMTSLPGLRWSTLHGDTDPIEIVGVVEDGKYQSLTEDAQPAMFFPLTQQINSNETVLVVRSSLPPSAMAATLDQALTSVDRNIPFMLHSWQDALDLALFPARAATAALGIMGLLAAMLAVTGIFGMAAYSVSRRMKELRASTTDALSARPPFDLAAVRFRSGPGIGRIGKPLARADRL
jgi:hypothetical protein